MNEADLLWRLSLIMKGQILHVHVSRSPEVNKARSFEDFKLSVEVLEQVAVLREID